MELPKVFDQEAKAGQFEPLPAGWYTARITEAELKTTKAGNGMYINIRYDILGPSHQGRVVYGMINISNPNQKAEEIGEQQMAHLRSSIGLKRVTDTNQILNGVCQIKLSVKLDAEYGDKNDIKGWKAVDGGIPPMPATPMSETKDATGTVPAFKDLPPWAK